MATVATITYEVRGNMQHLSHGDTIYPVQGGAVHLPYGEEWYQDLVNAGVLVKVGVVPAPKLPLPEPEVPADSVDDTPESHINLFGQD